MDSIQSAPEEDESLIYLAVGGIGAIFLGMALVTLRDFTSASNFAFPFMALTIAVAEFGGRRAAVVTALTSALSLDFFLTKPYLRLAIADKHDLIAFLGLTICGLIAAAFGTRRRRRSAAAHAAGTHLDLLRSALRNLGASGPSDQVLVRVLDDALSELPVSALVIRDGRGNVLAASSGAEHKPAPVQVVDARTLRGYGTSERGASTGTLAPGDAGIFPVEGARLPLGNGRAGWLEVWGNGRPAELEERRALSDLGQLLSLWIAARGEVPGQS
jgi:K+-sensing histidine kinase KdpD